LSAAWAALSPLIALLIKLDMEVPYTLSDMSPVEDYRQP